MQNQTNNFDEELTFWGDYFRRSKDLQTKVWVLSGNSSQFTSTILNFKSGKNAISIIDQFGGREPTLINYDSVIRGDFRAPIVPTVILDSHIVSNLRRYLNDPPFLDTPTHKVARKFLEFVVVKGCDYNPFFYYMESVAKNGNEKARLYAGESAKTMLRLHTMDELTFLRDDLIKPNWEAVEMYARKYNLGVIGPETLDEIAAFMADDMIGNTDVTGLMGMIDYSYAVLLKTVLINKKGKGDALAKWSILRDFMESEINVVLSRECAMAPYYFAGLLGKFMAVEMTMSFTDVRKRLRGTAWDLLLLRLPEFQLANSDEQLVVLSYVCSAEKDLRKIGRHFKIEWAVTSPELGPLPSTLVSFNLGELYAGMNREAVNEIVEEQQRRATARQIKSLMSNQKALPASQVTELIASLEEEVKTYCGGGNRKAS